MKAGLCEDPWRPLAPGKGKWFQARAHRAVARFSQRVGTVDVPEDERKLLKSFRIAHGALKKTLSRIEALDADPQPEVLPPRPTDEEIALVNDSRVYETYGGVRLKLMKSEEGLSGEKAETLCRLAERIGTISLEADRLPGIVRDRFARLAYPFAIDPGVKTKKDFRLKATATDIVVCFGDEAEREAWARIRVDGNTEKAFLRTVKAFRYRKTGSDAGRGEVIGTVTALFDEKSGTAELTCAGFLENEEGYAQRITIPFGRMRLKRLVRWDRKRRKLEQGRRFVFLFRGGRRALIRDPERLQDEIRKTFGGEHWAAVERGDSAFLEKEERRLRL